MSETMKAWSDQAELRLREWLKERVEREALRGADAEELAADLRRHVHEELENSAHETVGLMALESALLRACYEGSRGTMMSTDIAGWVMRGWQIPAAMFGRRGAIVLETAEQFAKHGLKPVDGAATPHLPSVPEPSVLWLVLVAAMGAAMGRSR